MEIYANFKITQILGKTQERSTKQRTNYNNEIQQRIIKEETTQSQQQKKR